MPEPSKLEIVAEADGYAIVLDGKQVASHDGDLLSALDVARSHLSGESDIAGPSARIFEVRLLQLTTKAFSESGTITVRAESEDEARTKVDATDLSTLAIAWEPQETGDDFPPEYVVESVTLSERTTGRVDIE